MSDHVLELLQCAGRQLIDAVDDNGIGLFELLAEDVGCLGRKAAARVVAQDAQSVARLK